MQISAETATVAVALIAAVSSVINNFMNRHQIKQSKEIKTSVNGTLDSLLTELKIAYKEIARLNLQLHPGDRRNKRERKTDRDDA